MPRTFTCKGRSMADIATIFSIKLNKSDFDAQLKQASQLSKDYNTQVAASLLQSAQLEQKRIELLNQRSVAQANSDKAAVKSINAELSATASLITAENRRISAINSVSSALQKMASIDKEATDAQIENAKRRESILSSLAAQKANAPIQEAQQRTQFTQTYQSTPELNKYNDAFEKLNALKAQGIISQKEYNSALAQEKEVLDKGVSARDDQFNHVIRMLRWAGTLAASYYGLSMAFKATLGHGIAVAGNFEQMQIGISSLIATFSQNVDSMGHVITATQKFSMAQQGAAEAIVMLRKANIDTPATLEQLTRGFQSALGPAQSMGFTLKQTVEYSRLMTLAASALTVPMDQLEQEMRSILNGTIDQNSVVANSLGITNEQIKVHAKLGDTYQFLVSKLQDFQSAGNAVNASWQGVTSNLSDAWDSFMAEFVKSTGLFGSAKSSVASLTNLLNNQNGSLDTLKNTLTTTGDAVTAFYATILAGRLINSAAVGVLVRYISLLGEAGGAAAVLKGIQLALNAAVAANPWVFVGTAIATAVTSLIEYKKLMGEINGSNAKTFGYNALSNDLQGLSGKSNSEALSHVAERSKEVYDEEVALQAEYRKRKGMMYESSKNSEEQEARKARIAGLDEEQKALVKYADYLKTAIQQKAKLISIGAGGGLTSQQILEMNKFAESHKTPEEKANKDLKSTTDILEASKKQLALDEASVAVTEKEKKVKEDILASDKVRLTTATSNVREAQIEVDKINQEKSSKAKSAKNQADRQELSDLEKFKQDLAAKEATQEAIDAQEAIKGVQLRVGAETELQKIKLNGFIQHQDLLQKDIDADRSLKNGKNADYKVNVDIVKLEESKKLQAEYILEIYKSQTAELNKQGGVAVTRLSSDLSRIMADTKKNATLSESFGKGIFSPNEADSAIDLASKSFVTNTASIAPTDDTHMEKSIAELNTFVEKINSKVAELPDVTLKIKLEGWDNASKAFATLGNSLIELTHANTKYNDEMKVGKQLLVEYKNDKEKYADTEEKIGNLTKQNAEDTISGYSGMIGAVSQFYGAETDQSKKLGEIQKALSSVKMAMQVAEFVQSSTFSTLFVAQEAAKATAAGGTAVAIAAQSSPWTGFATAAAMIAMLASVGVMFGGAISGSGGVKRDAFSEQIADTGTGTVLGDNAKQSASITDSLSILSSSVKPQLRLLSSMDTSLQSISQNIGGLAERIIEVGGVATSTAAGSFNPTTTTPSAVSSFLKTGVGTTLLTGATNVVSQLLKSVIGDNFISNIVGSITGAIGNLVSSIFGGSKSKSLSDSGLAFSAQTLSSAVQNLNGSSYQTIKTKTSGGWFSSGYTAYDSYFSALDASTKRQFELVLGNLQDITIQSASALNVSSADISASLSTFIVNLGKISLNGQTGAQIQATLTSIFGAIGDKIAATAFPALVPFQQEGEALFTTMIRVASGMQTADYYVSKLGVSFSQVKYTDLANTQGDVSVETLRQSILAVEGSTNGVAQIVANFSGTVADLFNTYTGLEKLRVSLNAIGLSANSLTSDMLYGAGGIDVLTTAMSDYVSNFLTQSQQITNQTATVRAEFTALGLVMPTSNAAFVSLVNSIDTTTAAGQQLFGSVMATAKDFSGLTSTISSDISNLTSAAQSLSDALVSMSNSIDSTIVSLENAITGGAQTVVSQQDLITTFWQDKNQAEGLLSLNGDLTDQQQKKLSDLMSNINGLATQIQGAQVGSNSSMTTSLIGQLQDLKNGVNLSNNVVQSAIINAQGDIVNVATEGTLSLLVAAVTASNPALGINGSHASGLASVPFDGYIAELHKGERVLTAQESMALGNTTYGRAIVSFDTSALERINNLIYAKISQVYQILNDAQIGARPLYMRAVV